ncbi:MAG: flagellar basal body-associated FliL family protein [Deltaproteobacteria bacterium]|nr:flagellar basal body-associated FliL family protein [Deltaproteobacteria bacterium]
MAEKKQEKPEKEEEQQQQEEKKGRFPVKLTILFALFLLVVGGGFFLWKGLLEAKFFPDEKTPPSVQGAQAEGKKGIGPVFPLEIFIVNLMDPQGKRYLKVKLELELTDDELKREIEGRLPQFRDAILTILSSKTYEEVSPLEGKLQLRAEIMSNLNQFLNGGAVTNIFFTEFIVQ